MFFMRVNEDHIEHEQLIIIVITFSICGCLQAVAVKDPVCSTRLDPKELPITQYFWVNSILLAHLYYKLEYVSVPKFYEEDDQVAMMENSIGKIAYYSNTHRMMRSHATDAYLWLRFSLRIIQ